MARFSAPLQVHPSSSPLPSLGGGSLHAGAASRACAICARLLEELPMRCSEGKSEREREEKERERERERKREGESERKRERERKR
eukprot:5757142-Pyramimonas_sp.AAC.1